MDPSQINWDTGSEGVTAHLDITCEKNGQIVLRTGDRSQTFSNKEEALKYFDSLVTYGVSAAE